MNKTLIALLVIVALGLIGVSQAFFIVDQREQAFVLQLGQPVGKPKEPGLHFKLPIVQEVRRFDKRILSVDPEPEQVVISSDSIAQPAGTDENEAGIPENITGEPIILDTFARYQITDPLQFMKTLRTIRFANVRLEGILKNATKAALGQTSLQELLSPTRDDVMRTIKERVNADVHKSKMGIEIVDVRIVRADLTSDLRTSTVRRMVSELKARATETRAKGEERALEIRSTAEKERTVLIAEAQRDSEIIKGQGDKEAIKVYAKAFNKDKNFYGFIRSLEAYKKTMANSDTRLVLSPDSDFFRYFENLDGVR